MALPHPNIAEYGYLPFLWVIICVGTLYAFAKGLYNVYFHPLAKYPGPRFAAATKIPIARASWKGQLSHWLADLHHVFESDVVRVSPDELSFIGPSAWKDLYGHKQGQAQFAKDLVLYSGINSIVTAPDADHSRMRRLLAHAFSDRALKEQEQLIQAHIDDLIQGLKRAVKGPPQGKVNLADWFNWTTFDIVGDLSFGEPFGCLKETTYHPWVAMLMNNLRLVVYQSVTLRFPPLSRLLRYIVPKKAVQDRIDHKRMAMEKVERRMETPNDRPDFMSYILKHNNTKSGMTREEIHENAATFVAAGSETTAALLAAAIWFLLHNPEYMFRIKDEVRKALVARGDITLQNIEKLEYFHSVINETFRMYPPALAGQPRIAPPQGGYVSGHWVPPSTGVQFNQYAANMSRLNFSDPRVFKPERWLGNPKFASDKLEVVQPFSIGARNCIGKK